MDNSLILQHSPLLVGSLPLGFELKTSNFDTILNYMHQPIQLKSLRWWEEVGNLLILQQLSKPCLCNDLSISDNANYLIFLHLRTHHKQFWSVYTRLEHFKGSMLKYELHTSPYQFKLLGWIGLCMQSIWYQGQRSRVRILAGAIK